MNTNLGTAVARNSRGFLYMGTITALTLQKRQKNRVNVFLDGAFAFGLTADLAARLKIGQFLSPEEIGSLLGDELVEKAKQSAYRFVSYRPRSVVEVERNLRKKTYDETIVKQVVAHLQKIELLDDEAFARYWVEQRDTFKPRSRLALRQELGQKGIDRNVIELVLLDVDDTAVARTAAQKQMYRWQDLPSAEFRKKMGQFLQRRGFSYEIIKEITNEMWENLEQGE